MNENLEALVLYMAKELNAADVHPDAELVSLIKAVESDRATSEQLSEIGKDVEKVFGPMCERCGYATTHCKCPVASDRAEPTATELERLSGWCCEQTHPDGRRCINPVATGKSHCWGKYHKYSPIGKATAPDVPSEGEYRHCNTCGMRSHGTNAELRSQVETLQKRLDMFDAVNKRQASHIDKLQGELTQAKRDTEKLRAKLKAFEENHEAVLTYHDEMNAISKSSLIELHDEIAKLLKVIAVAKKYVDSFDGRTVGGRTVDFVQEFKLVYGVHGLDKKAGGA